MALAEDILEIIEKIFEDEGLSDEFFTLSEISDIIDDEYLSEFRDFDDYKKDKKDEDWWIPSGDKNSTEKDRRKKYESSGNGRFRRLDSFISISEIDPRLNGLLNKEGLKSRIPDLFLAYYYYMFSKEKGGKILLSFLSAIFDENYNENIDLYDKYLTLHGLFEPYFLPFKMPTSSSSFTRLEMAAARFRKIETSKDNKGLKPDSFEELSPFLIPYHGDRKDGLYYKNVGTTDPAKDFDGTINYTIEGLKKILELQEFPLVKIPEDSEENYYRKYFNNEFINGFVSSLAKEYGDNEEITTLLRIFLKSIGYTEEEINRFSYLFTFPDLDFSNCSEDVVVDDATEKTPDCDNEFYEILPADWTSAQTNKIFFDEPSCSYAINFVTDYENTSKLSLSNIEKEYRQKVAMMFLELLGKDYDSKTLKEVSDKVIFKKNFIPPQPLLKMKLLVLLKKEDVSGLEDTAPALSEEDVTVSYNIKSFMSNMESFSDLMSIYQQRMVVDTLRGASVYYENLDFQKEARMMDEFSNNIARLIRPVGIYETIDISFSGNKITSIELRKRGFKKRSITNGIVTFSTSSPQTRSRTINFIKNLTEIIEFFKQDRSQKYDAFVETFFIPTPTRKGVKNRIFDYANGAQQPIDTAPFGEIAKRSLDVVASEVKRGYTNFSCLTEEDKDSLEKKSEEDLENKEKFGKQLRVQIEDRFFSEAPQIFEKVSAGEGKEALNSLGKEFLNRLGVCGIGDLVSLATNTVMAFMDPEEYMDELLKCAISKMDPDTAKRFYGKVNQSQFLENLNSGTNFLNTYRNMVGDTLLPWDSQSLNTPGSVRNLDENILELADIEDYELRIQALGDAIVVNFDTRQLLELLKDLPGGEWIRYFIELSDSIIRQCRVVNGSDSGFLTNIRLKKEFRNLCEGDKRKPKMPKTPEVQTQRRKTVGEILAENSKEIVVNMAVRLVVGSFRELMKNVSAALAFDVSYFKKGQVFPDFFQDDQYFYNIIRDSSNMTSISDEQINQMFLDTCRQMGFEGFDEIGGDSMGNFLSNTSLVLDQNQKIDLLKGNPSRITSENILQASPTNGVSRILQKDPSRIGDIFEKFGQNVNIEKIEEDLSSELEDSTIDSFFCLGKNKDYENALTEKGLSEDEIEDQIKEKLEREKEKLCNLTNLMSNPVAPIFGNALSKLFSKDGPIFGKLEEEKFEILKSSLSREYELLSIPMSEDLYNGRDGFLELILHSQAGYTPTRSEFKELEENVSNGSAYVNFYDALISNTNFKFNSLLENEAYSFSLGSKKISLVESVDGTNRISISGKEVANYKTSFDEEILSEEILETVPEFISVTGETIGEREITKTIEKGTLNREASNMLRLLNDSIKLDSETFNKKDVVNSIVDENMPLLVERYYGKIKRALLKSESFTYEDWEKIYPLFTKSRITKLMDIKGSLDRDLLFYQKLENDERIGQKKRLIYESPFDKVMTKADTVRVSLLVELMFRTYAVESIMKSFFSFKSFSSNFFQDSDVLSSYIISQMRSDLGREYLPFADLAMQIYLQKVALGIREIINEDAQESYEKLSENISNFRDEEREDIGAFLDDNRDLIEDLVADYAESTILSTVDSFKDAFGSEIIFSDQFIIGPIISGGELRNVVSDVNVSEEFPEIKGGLFPDYQKTRIIIEKFIFIEDREAVPFSLRSEISNRQDNLFNVVNLDKWDSYISSYKDDFSDYKISDLWSSWKFGLRMSYVMPKFIEKDDTSYKNRQNNKSYNVTFNGEEVTLIPFAESLTEIPDQKITPNISKEYDLSCLIYDLSKTEEYKKMFHDIIDIETIISLITIYSVDEFANFLGEGEKKTSDLNRWQKDPKSFTRTKEAIIKILEDF